MEPERDATAPRPRETGAHPLIRGCARLRIPATKRTVRQQLRTPELKAVDTNIGGPVDTTGALYLLNGTQPGTGFNQRIGRQIRMVRLKLNCALQVTPSTGKDQTHRLLVFLDRQPNGGAPALTDVLDSASPRAQLNLSNQSRFKVLLDRVVYLNASGEPGSSSVEFHKRKLGFVVQYNTGAAGTVADIATNSLYLLVVGDVVAGSAAGVTQGVCRVRYHDD